ncbi:iron hydrogenase, partial [Rhodotorula sp. JG-1b]
SDPSQTLADLSDYLAPSQACIKPVTYVPDEKAEVNELDKPAVAAAVRGVLGKKLKKAEITLNDCLACSGCITSAESVLVSLQSHEEVYRVLREQLELVPIASISPQSVASLAALYDLTLDEAMRGLRRFFRQSLGFRLVFDTTFPRALSLLESRAELHERRSHFYASPTPNLPSILSASACPGWICYAEKTHGDLLPFVSGVKSPQAVAGVLVKGNVVAGRLGLRPDQIYHVAVMPCYDKKLEASRPDFATAHPAPSTSTSTEPVSVRDVDLVLTTGEVAKMLSEKGLSLRDLGAGSADATEAGLYDGAEEATFFPFSQLLDPPVGTSSGSYVQAALSTLLDPPSTSSPSSSRSPVLTSADWPYLRLSSKLVRNDDYVEFTLRRVSTAYSPATSHPDQPEDEGTVIARAAKCYGFRNLQNVVRKISREAGIFIEVMACPSGCVNGGGQVPPP